jgi:adenylosuccinate lyase
MSHYNSPLSERYASAHMQSLFSTQERAHTWRLLWHRLATEQQKLGLAISAQQLEEMAENCDTIDFSRVREIEQETRHDVMAHIRAFGEQCPSAKGIIHLGATSCYVTDNADLILFRRALDLIGEKLHNLLGLLGQEAEKLAEFPCLAFTHLQPAQPTTVGKRIALWTQDLLWDHTSLQRLNYELPFLGAKGATGTQASFLSLFDGDKEKVTALDHAVARHFSFTRVLNVSGQTYPRKIDAQILNALGGIATSAHKMCTDLRLLANMGEFSEPQRSGQVGSSAMPYKQNPMMSERCCSLARFLLSLQQNGSHTAAVQWLERSLDDSANRRLSLPEAFLTADAVLNLLTNLVHGWNFHSAVIVRRLKEQLPFLVSEEILMSAVTAGGDRQEVHEKLRVHSREAAEQLRTIGQNDLLDRIANDTTIPLNRKDLEQTLQSENLIGLCPEQVASFLADELTPHLSRWTTSDRLDTAVEV